ncbi:MAG TPA: sigma-70 family RNA polymerase sigma factor [Gemmataceae bacterium]|jgi:RNA polymerase sigma factor (sigma-70 family)|nr:sigma-70 family RNA polymerase sigma factor [Gemmataceae bacterium]
MGTNPLAVAAQQLRAAVARYDASDGELLEVFVAVRDEDAFAVLLARHGPMVLQVCRRLLGNAADAEDAFQAAFLALALRAGGLAGVRSVAGWLHGVAVRVAMKARTREARRRARERKAAVMRPTDASDGADLKDVRPVLDEELDRLGGRYRDPIVLCCLEGRSREEAARRLGWPEGTVSGRLARGKELLRARLTRRGVTCSSIALAVLLSAHGASAVPTELSRATLAAVAGSAPAVVAGLAAGVRAGRWGWRMKAAVLTGGAVVGGLAALAAWDLPVLNAPRPSSRPDHPAAPVRLAHGTEVLAVAVSPGGLVATVGAGSEARVWKPDGMPVARCALPGGGASVGFAPDGGALAAAGYDGAVRVWDAANGALRHTLPGYGEAAHAVAFSPDGSLLATAGADGRVRLWDPATGRHLRDLEAHRGRVWGLCFAPDGRELASAGGDQTVRIWDPAAGTEVHRFPGLRGGAYAVEYHPAGHALAVAADNTVLLLDARTGREQGRVGTPRTAVTWFAFAPDGRSLAYRDGKAVRLWELASGSDRLTLDLPAEPAGLAFTPSGRSLVVAAGDGAAVWELRRLARPLPATDPNALWAHLAGADAALAFRAVETLAAEPGKAVPLIRGKLHAVPDLRGRIDELVRQLDDDRFDVRERASRALGAIGPDAAPALRRTVSGSPSPEVRQRADRLLARLPDPPSAESARPLPVHSRSVEVLERAGTAEARAALTALADRELDTPLKRDATAALARLRKTAP